MANYLVVTCKDRIQVETAYTALESAGLALNQVKILGQGYKNLATDPVFDPALVIRDRIRQMFLWLIPFGFFAGFTFNQVTEISIVPELGMLGNGVLGGLLGAASGALGSFVVNGGLTLLLQGQERISFGDRLKAGKYLLVVKGSPALIQQANRIIRTLSWEMLQMFESPETDSIQ